MTGETVINDTNRNSTAAVNGSTTVINGGNGTAGTVINEGRSFSSKLKTAVNTGNSDINPVKTFNADDVIAERYRVIRKISMGSGEADIYQVLDLNENNAVKALKLFRRRNAIKSDVISRLMSQSSPYVAAFSDTGTVDDLTYLVMPYYAKGSLASYIDKGITFSTEEIKNLILPSAIEGLKAIHDLGIIHKDLKPGNMMIADDESHIVLIDFGISSVTDGSTMVVTQTGKSPFYSAPETATGLFWSGSDYYSLGISLYELHTGSTPYQNADINDISRYALSQKIPYPKDFDPELKDLIDGLTFKDISYRNDPDNPNRRWDYDEVRLWLQGKKPPVPGRTAEGGSPQNTYPYMFAGNKYYGRDEIVRALIKLWNFGKKEVFRGFLTRYFEITNDSEALTLCRKAEEEFGKAPEKADAIFFRLMYGLSPNLKDLVWGSSVFPDLKTYARKLKNILVGRGSNFICSSARLLLEDGTVDAYLRNVGGDDALLISRHLEPARILAESYIRKFGNDDRDETDRYIAVILVNTLLNKSIMMMGRLMFDDVKQFRTYIQNISNEPLKKAEFCHDNADVLRKAASTLSQSDYESLKPLLPILMSDAEKDELSMFYFDDYVFRNREEATAYYENIRTKARKHPKHADVTERYNRFNTGFTKAVGKFVTDPEDLSKLINSTKIGYTINRFLSGEPKEGKIVEFGSYVPASGKSRIPIKWLVLDTDTSKDHVLLISVDVLKIRGYDTLATQPLPSAYKSCDSSVFLVNALKAVIFWPTFAPFIALLVKLVTANITLGFSAEAIRSILRVIMLPYLLPYHFAEKLHSGLSGAVIVLGIAYLILTLVYFRRINGYLNNLSSGRDEWANSEMRKWMNTELIDELFTAEERIFIQTTTFSGSKNKLVLLSSSEVTKYMPTPQMAVAGLYGRKRKSDWWLRDPYFPRYTYEGSTPHNVTVSDTGTFSDEYHGSHYCGVRPAMWLKI